MRARAPVILLTLLASFLIPAMIGNVQAASCPPGNCQVDVNSNVPAADATIWVEIDNSSSNIVSLPNSFSFAYNTTHTLTVLNTTAFTGASTGGHYVWKEWAIYYGTTSPGTTLWTTNPTLRVCPGNTCSPNGDIFNYTSPGGFTAVFDKQYPATLSFTDASGNTLSTVPTKVRLQPQGYGPAITISPSYTGQYLSANLYTVLNVTWEGTPMDLSSSGQTIDLTNGPASATIQIKAYPATVQVVDNNNKPVQGASVTITFANQTARTFISNSKGQVNLGDIPVGSFGVTVNYQNQAYGPYTPDVVGNPTYTVQVNTGSAPTSTTTAIVLLAIFGIAFFLILLAIKVRKPPAPPSIQ